MPLPSTQKTLKWFAWKSCCIFLAEARWQGELPPRLSKVPNDPEAYSATEAKSTGGKRECSGICQLGLEATQDLTKIRRIEVKLSQGYYMKLIPVWRLLDKEGNTIDISLEPQKGSGRRGAMGGKGSRRGCANQSFTKWLMWWYVCPKTYY